MKREKKIPELTEKEAALQFARAYNRLDPVDLIPLLAPDVVMDSYQVFTALEGKEEVADYFKGKLATVKNGCIERPWYRFYAEPAVAGSTMIYPEDPDVHVYDIYDHADMVVFTIDNPPGEHQRSYPGSLLPDRDCVLLSKGLEAVVVFFTVKGPYIKMINYLPPTFHTYRRSGIYPE